MTSTAQTKTHTGTFTALRYSNFRLYFVGQLISMSGTWMQTVAQGYLVFSLTRSEFWLGIVACASGLPMLLLAPYGGVLVERLPRRRLLLFTQVAQMILAFTLALLVFTNSVQIWHVVVLAFLLGVINALDAPARLTFVSDLVSKDDLTSGIALNSLIISSSRVLGPTFAGLLLASLGAAWCFFLNGLSFLAVIFILAILRVTPGMPPLRKAPVLDQLKEGVRFARAHPVILPVLLMTVNAAVLIASVITLFPAFADRILHSPREGYAILATANGAGAVLAGLLVSVLGPRLGQGRFLTLTGVATPLGFMLLSLSASLPLAALFSLICGFLTVSMFVTMNTTIQTIAPEGLRGRVLSLYTLAFFGTTPFGALALGVLAENIGTANAMLLYTALGLVFAVIILSRAPRLRAVVFG